MRKSPTQIFLTLLLAALIFCGCARDRSVVSRSRLAVSKCNQEAKRLYHIEPFKEEHGQWRSEGHQQIWEALTSSAGHDMTGKVVFDPQGSVVSVGVQMLSHPTRPETATNLNPVLAPDTKPERRRSIPEVMPK